ncbi:hypothetical protein BIT17_3722 [Mycobacterium tuberculosis variant bovis]|nr:hypothetical protein BIT17_3722 [Mycobacterium tuberculosis variant bovis]
MPRREFPSPLGVLGLTTDRVRWSLIGSPSFRPLSGFWV